MDFTLATLADTIAALTPAKVQRENGDSPTPRAVRVEARRSIILALAAIYNREDCAWASFTIVNNDDSTMPFRAYAEGILGVRDSGKAYAVDCR